MTKFTPNRQKLSRMIQILINTFLSGFQELSVKLHFSEKVFANRFKSLIMNGKRVSPKIELTKRKYVVQSYINSYLRAIHCEKHFQILQRRFQGQKR